MHRYSLLPLLRGVTTAAAVASIVLLAPTSFAQTADGQTPAEEHICDGKTGAVWGLCVAYCEAMDCDYAFPHASEEACDHVLANYLKKANGELPPCETLTPE